MNDSPKDKATFDFRVAVACRPDRNGQRRADLTAHKAREDDLALAGAHADGAVPRHRHERRVQHELLHAAERAADVRRDRSHDAAIRRSPADSLRRAQGKSSTFFSSWYGPYPYTSGGGIIADNASFVGYALESQTRANYPGTPGATTIIHEIAHQWFGNAVTLEQWPDIWLHEGFARWSEWFYEEKPRRVGRPRRASTPVTRARPTTRTGPSRPAMSAAPRTCSRLRSMTAAR